MKKNRFCNKVIHLGKPYGANGIFILSSKNWKEILKDVWRIYMYANSLATHIDFFQDHSDDKENSKFIYDICKEDSKLIKDAFNDLTGRTGNILF